MPKGDRPSTPPIERIAARTVIDGTCWRFTGCHDRGGYGRITVGSRKDGTRRLTSVHQVSFVHFHGPVPEGMEIDHVRARGCRFTDCWNPDHLEAVSHAENLKNERVNPACHDRRTEWARELARLGRAAQDARRA